MNEWIGVAAVFLLGTGVTFVILRLLRGNPVPKPTTDDDDAPPEMVFGAWTPALAKQLQPGEEGAQDLQQALRAAGFYEKNAITQYTAIRFLMTVMPLVATGLLALLIDPPGTYWVIGGGLMAAILGFSMPRVWLSAKIRARLREIEKALPAAIDLMTLSLSAGQTLQASIDMAAKELKPTFPPMAVELDITQQHTSLHSLEYALVQLADRIRLSDVRNLSLMLIQSERLGTDTGSTLLEFATNMRVTMKQRADHRANQASFWMLIPSVCCLWVAAAIVLVGPAYMEFWRYRQESAELLSKGQKTIENSNRPVTPRLPQDATGTVP